MPLTNETRLSPNDFVLKELYIIPPPLLFIFYVHLPVEQVYCDGSSGEAKDQIVVWKKSLSMDGWMDAQLARCSMA